jgi:hypothetical protein
MKRFLLIIYLVLSFFIFSQSDYETNFLQGYLNFEKAFLQLSGDYGTTFFPFLNLGYGGRESGLSQAFTGVADDIGTLESNPAGTSSLKQTELFFSHVKLMGDVNYNTLAYTMRFNDLAFGIGARVLYMPFVHFDQFGENVGDGVITNTVITCNLSYNFLRSYEFFGLSVGANAKLYIYGVPDEIASNQTKVNAAFDVGLLTRFNFLKAYNRAEKNFGIGLTIANLGPFTDEEPPPTTISLGISYKPIYQLMFAIDFNYLINYSSYTYKNWSVNVGIEWKFTKYSSIMGGVTIKSSPSFSLGVNVEFDDFKITAVYSPDLVDVSKFSISASLKLGDLGREKKETEVKKMYSNALRLMSEGNYDLAIDQLKEIIKKDRTFTPAKKSLAQCHKQNETQKDLDIIIENRLQ